MLRVVAYRATVARREHEAETAWFPPEIKNNTKVFIDPYLLQ